MLKKIVLGLLIFALLGCVAGAVAGSAFVYILCFMALVSAGLFLLFLLATGVIRKLVPVTVKRAYQAKSALFNTIFFFLFMAFLALLFFNSINFKSGEITSGSDISKLGSLPYLEWFPVKNIKTTGVVLYNRELAFDGWNFYGSWSRPEAYLVDMEGNVVHKWAAVLPGCDKFKDHVELCRNGDVLLLELDKRLVCFDWDSNVKWMKNMRVHHDIFPAPDGQRFYVLAREDAIVYWHGIPVPMLNEFIAVVSPNEEAVTKIYLYDLVKDRIKPAAIAGLYAGMFKPKEIVKFFVHKIQSGWVCQHSLHCDIMHTNSIEVIDRNIEGFCKEGDILLSMRELDLVAVLDTDKMALTWTWGPGEVDMQHDAQLLENGNVLVYDNGCDRRFTRIVEVDPLTGEVVWEYKADPAEEFYSSLSGSCQRLDNGNTLIAESTRGRAFEVTKEGKTVWDYYNPHVDKKGKKREVIYRIRRFSNPQIENLLKNSSRNTEIKGLR